MLRPRIALAATLWFAGLAPLTAQDRLAIHSEPGTAVIATEVLIATGPADEPDGRAGVAHLSARAVTTPIGAALDSLDAHLEIRSSKDAIGFRLIAAPDAWSEATRLLMLALFRDPVQAASVASERARMEAELTGRRDNPADAAARAADAAFFGTDHPWGRPEVGEIATIRQLTHAHVDEFLRTHFRPERAFASVVGPVEPDTVRRHLAAYLQSPGTGSDRPSPAEPRAPRRSPVFTDYNSVTSWVTVIVPFARGADIEALRMLAHLIGDEISFGPTRRSVYDARAEVIRRTDGGELRMTVVVPPAEAEAWAERIVDLVGGLVDETFLEEGWGGRLRRYRGERLHQLAAPEDRAAELVRTLFVARTAGTPLPEIEDLTLRRLRSASAALGAPTVAILGPVLDDQD